MSRIHIVSHTHWDREWHHTFQQFRVRLVILIDELLDILNKDNDYKYFMLDGQTIVLDDYLEIRPEREAELWKHIQSGRISIGPWYVLADEFLTSGEAAIRNLLEGDRTARRFGAKLMVGYVPDTFGHIGQLPQILNGFNIHSAALWRGLADQPNELWWESPDGSRVLLAFLRDGYMNASGIVRNKPADSFERILHQKEKLAPYAIGEDLLLMNGIDHTFPEPGLPGVIRFAKEQIKDEVLHSSLSNYFAQIRLNTDLTSLPVEKGN